MDKKALPLIFQNAKNPLPCLTDIGLKVFLVKPKEKTPFRKGWQDQATGDPKHLYQLLMKSPTCNIGVKTGMDSGVFVVDVDPKKDGLNSLEQLEWDYGALPATVEAETSKGGRHLYFVYPEGLKIKNSVSKVARGIDIRGEGGYVVAPPSIHPSGHIYKWKTGHHPNDLEVAEAPGWLLDRIPPPSPPPALPLESTSNGSIPEGERNATLASLAGGMRHRGCSEQDILASLLEENKKKCWPPLPKEEVRGIAHSIAQYPPGAQPSFADNLSPSSNTPPWPTPPDQVVYHGLAGEFVRLVEPHSEADPIAVLVQLLVAVGSVIGRTAYFEAEGTRHHLNMFVVIVGRTSKARKGSSWSHVKRFLAACDFMWVADRVKSGLSSGEGLIWSVRDPSYESKPNKKKGKDAGENKPSCTDRGVQDKRLLVQEAEFATVLRMTDRDGNTLSALIRKAWETGDLESLTKNSPAKATNAHISIVGHIVKDELCRYLGRTEVGNGFANRFLFSCAKRSKELPEGGQINEEEFDGLVERLKVAINTAQGIGELKRDEDARKLWRKVYGKLSEGAPGLFGAVTSRGEAQVMRLACIYAVLDGSPEIRAVHLQAALALWKYCEDSVRHIFGEALGDPIADEIMNALRTNLSGLTRTQISGLFGRNREKDQIGRALGVLLEHGRVRVETEQTSGRSVERWFAI